MIAYYMVYYMHIIYLYISKLFFILTINGNNCLCYDIIIYKFNVVIWKSIIKKLSLSSYDYYFKSSSEYYPYNII